MVPRSPHRILVVVLLAAVCCAALHDSADANASQTVLRADQLSLGGEHSCALTADDVLCWGSNRDGQLGTGARTLEHGIAVEVPGLPEGVQQVASGNNFSCALASLGDVYCWGSNASSQLGATSSDSCEDFACSRTPLHVAGLSGVTSISTGFGHACALSPGIAPQCWGLNLYGQLGDGTVQSRLGPAPVQRIKDDIATVVAGDVQTCALMADSTVRCWGNGFLGELGDGTLLSSFTPVEVCAPAGCPGVLTDVEQLSLGDHHACAITSAGAVFCWGSNASRQLGVGTATACECSSLPVFVAGLPAPARLVAAATASTCAILAEGQVYCWGLDFGSGHTSSAPHRIEGWPDTPSEIAVAFTHACAVTEQQVSCFGANKRGQLGDGTRGDRDERRPTPVWRLSNRGDADCSADISSLDALRVLQIAAGLATVAPCARASHNDSLAALAILQFDAKLLG